MYNILVVEDDFLQLNALKECIEKTFNQFNVTTAKSYEAALSLIKSSFTYSLFILDVKLSDNINDRGGFFLAENIRSIKQYFQTPILFLTSIANEGMYALSNFHCYNYLCKPYTMNAICDQIKQMIKTGHIDSSLKITDTKHVSHIISEDNIMYCESYRHIIYIHTQEDYIITRAHTLNDFEKMLGRNFIRCHKSFLVNSKYISSIDRANAKLILSNKKTIDIGKTYLQTITI